MKTVERYFPFFLIAGILINANGLFIDILEPDGALYATISKHIALSGDWINLFGDNHDWLDKPHFPFWITALSFKIFGITPFSYKIPAFIFWLASIWFTYQLSKQLYSKDVAKVSVLIYVFSLHSILNNFDVRAEPYLTALIIAAIYYTYKATISRSWIWLIAAAVASACAVMTKGIFTLITIFSGFAIYWLIAKQWKQFVNYRWWVLVLLILLFITPELYSLYVQFDLHPEKIVFGRTNVSGVRFFFWDSQFGRFFNTGPIKGHGDPAFFLHTTLWAFLPWSIVLYIAVVSLIRRGNTKEDFNPGWIVFGSAIVTFLLFSFSGFQLPHYIVILFPHFSIVTARYLSSIQKPQTFKRLIVGQTILLLLALLMVNVLAFYSGFGNILIVAGLSLVEVVLVLLFFKEAGLNKLVAITSSVSILLFLYLFNFFYPRLLHYQAGMQAGKWLTDHKFNGKTATLNTMSYSFEFYSPGYVQYINNTDDVNNFIGKNTSAAFYTTKGMLSELQQKGYQFTVVKFLPYFHVSMLTGSFLNPATREDEVEKMALILIQKKLPG
jgi:4-amino-4-deoxy-L-arabinose transferase-like glycosyltransferase